MVQSDLGLKTREALTIANDWTLNPLAYTQISKEMPPKGSKKSFAQRGNVVPHGNGFRALAYMGGRTQCGPTRATEAEANCDLREARDAASETEYSSVLQ